MGPGARPHDTGPIRRGRGREEPAALLGRRPATTLTDHQHERLDRPYLEAERNPIHLYAEFETKHWWFWARRQILRRLVRSVFAPSRKRVILDVGCGPGENISSLAQDYECHGIDTSREAIETARRRHPEVQFTCGLAPEAVSDVARRADLVLIMDVLEHLEDPRALLAELVEAVEPGTYFMVTVPAGPHLWSEHDFTVGHHRRYTKETFRELWTDLPVAETYCSYFMSYLYPVVRAVRALNRLRGRSSGAEGTDLRMPPRPFNDVLGRVFAAEKRVLAALLEGRRTRGFEHGVSLIGVLRKLEGERRQTPA